MTFEFSKGAVARSVVRPSTITCCRQTQDLHTSGTFFSEDFVMKILLLPFFLFQSKKSSCQLLVKECTLEPPGGLRRNSLVRLTARPDMI